MSSEPNTHTFCLEHHAVEDQMSLLGFVCAQCKHRLYTRPPRGLCRSYWISQPGAYGLDRAPCFVYVIQWDDFRIRSLHPAHSEIDPRFERIQAANARQQAEDESLQEATDPETGFEMDGFESFDPEGFDFEPDHSPDIDLDFGSWSDE
jgi:hypothetical protein